jgi:hypothetical protein
VSDIFFWHCSTPCVTESYVKDDTGSFFMADRTITAEQVKASLMKDFEALAEALAAAAKAARAGSIIADSEEPVRDAHAEFRRQSYQKALDLLASQQGQEDFSPSQDPTGRDVAEQGKAGRHARHRQRGR